MYQYFCGESQSFHRKIKLSVHIAAVFNTLLIYQILFAIYTLANLLKLVFIREFVG